MVLTIVSAIFASIPNTVHPHLKASFFSITFFAFRLLPMQNSYVLLDDLIVIFFCSEHFRCGDASSDVFFLSLLVFNFCSILPVRTRCSTNHKKKTYYECTFFHCTFFGLQFVSIMYWMVCIPFLWWTQYFRLILKDSQENVQIVFFSPGQYSFIFALSIYTSLCLLSEIANYGHQLFFFCSKCCCHCLHRRRHYMVWLFFLGFCRV